MPSSNRSFPAHKSSSAGIPLEGGLAIRFAGSEYGELADGYLLLARF
ncbi:MAG: hypothetical protein IPM76_18640 [Chloroflexi bacterium]|nr:hypothetical protein [Chloroflexota bacterium]